MKEKMNVGEIVKIGVILFLITAISAALLAFVNGKTAPLIEKNSLAKEQDALKSVMPDAEKFVEIDFHRADENIGLLDGIMFSMDGANEIIKAFYADNDKDEAIGVCVITQTSGYDVGIQTVTGVDKDLTVTGVDIISMNETPGLGAKADEEDFRSQYNGKKFEIGVSKSAAGDNEIQAISGATKTSNGVTRGVNLALEAAEEVLNTPYRCEKRGGDE